MPEIQSSATNTWQLSMSPMASLQASTQMLLNICVDVLKNQMARPPILDVLANFATGKPFSAV